MEALLSRVYDPFSYNEGNSSLTDHNRARPVLEGLNCGDRIATISADVASKRDEFRSIEPKDLMDLLGVPTSEDKFGSCIAGNEWDRTYYVINRTFDDLEIQVEDVLRQLEGGITEIRYAELEKSLVSSKATLTKGEIDVLTDPEMSILLS